MWQRFTERARAAVWRSTEEATTLAAQFVGAEHLFLGLLHDPESVSSRILRDLGGDLEALRAAVLEQVTQSAVPSPPEPPCTPRFKHVIDAAYANAWDLSNNYIGTEHLLLGIFHEDGSLGAQVLRRAGIGYRAALEQNRPMRGDATTRTDLPAWIERITVVPEGFAGMFEKIGYVALLDLLDFPHAAVRGQFYEGLAAAGVPAETADSVSLEELVRFPLRHRLVYRGVQSLGWLETGFPMDEQTAGLLRDYSEAEGLTPGERQRAGRLVAA